MENSYLILGIICASVFTLLTRVIPFVFFENKKPTRTFKYIEMYMPSMIMVILIFYSLRNVDFMLYSYGLPEIVGILIAACVHIVFKQALLSIVIATIAYMYMVQVII